MKTTLLPRLAVAGLLATVWLATSAYTTPALGTFRPALPAGTPSSYQPIKELEIGQLRSSQYILDDPATMMQQYYIGPMTGQQPTLPGSLLDAYATDTDFSEFDQLATPR